MNQTQLRRMLCSLGDATEATTWSALRNAVLISAVAVVGADSALVSGVGSGARRVSTWPDNFLTAEQQIAFGQLHASDAWPLATMRIHSELFANLECEHQAAFAIVVDSRRRLCVAVIRADRDFSGDDIAGLDALRRPLTACASRIAQLERLAISAPANSATLSQREGDVLSLVASGLTDDQVGRRLGISSRTVNKHLEHIYQKTGLRNRTQAANRWHQLHSRSATPQEGEGAAAHPGFRAENVSP